MFVTEDGFQFMLCVIRRTLSHASIFITITKDDERYPLDATIYLLL